MTDYNNFMMTFKIEGVDDHDIHFQLGVKCSQETSLIFAKQMQELVLATIEKGISKVKAGKESKNVEN